MITRLQKSIAIVLLAICFLVACLEEWQSSVRQSQEAKTYLTALKLKIEDLPWPSPESWTAIFTGILTFSTIGLWSVTRRAADAAKAAADALPVVERAYVYPVIESTGRISQCVQEALVFHLDEAQADTPCPSTTAISFKIKNYGKTPAVLKEVFAGFGIYPVGALLGLVLPEGILGDGETTSLLISEMHRGLTRNEAQHVRFYTRYITFDGHITFEDIWGNNYRTHFEFAWEPSTEKMQLSNLRTERA